MNQDGSELFEQTFKSLYPVVFRRLRNLTQDDAVAEDLAQEAFLRLYKFPPDDMSRIGAWLHRVSTNLAYDYLSKQRKHGTAKLVESLDEQPESAVFPASDVLALQKMETDEVQRALAALSERDRKALVLRNSGYSYKEISEQIHVNEDTVGTILVRALNRLKKQFMAGEVR